MITRADLFLLLDDIKTSGVDTTGMQKKLLRSNGIDIDVISFVNKHRQLPVTDFYKKIRKSYNEKHSKLYINIMKEVDAPSDVLVTLSALLTQAILFSEKTQDAALFMKHSRCDEISKALSRYFSTFDLVPCVKLINLIKADIKALEFVSVNN